MSLFFILVLILQFLVIFLRWDKVSVFDLHIKSLDKISSSDSATSIISVFSLFESVPLSSILLFEILFVLDLFNSPLFYIVTADAVNVFYCGLG